MYPFALLLFSSTILAPNFVFPPKFGCQEFREEFFTQKEAGSLNPRINTEPGSGWERNNWFLGKKAKSGLRLIPSLSVSSKCGRRCSSLFIGINIGKLGIQTGMKVKCVCVCVCVFTKYICAYLFLLYTYTVMFPFQIFQLLSHFSVNSDYQKKKERKGGKNWVPSIHTCNCSHLILVQPATFFGGAPKQVCFSQYLHVFQCPIRLSSSS